MMRESKDMEIRRHQPNVKIVRKWKANAKRDDILSSITHRDMIRASQIRRKGPGFDADRLTFLRL